MVVLPERLPMATWVVEAQELETEPLRYPELEKSQVRRLEMIPISSSRSAGLITATGVPAGVVLYYKKKKRITGVQTEEE